MNILIINHYAGSPKYGMEFRPYYLAKEWQKSGHNVLIVASTFSHLKNIQPKAGEEIIDGIKYLWIKGIRYKGNGISRALSMLLFVSKLFIFSSKIIRRIKPDVVIASSTYPFDIYPANFIAKKCNAKLVFELHDMWPLSPMLIGNISKHHPFIRLTQKAENFACKKCDCYVSLLGNAKEYLVQHGLNRDKFFYIPNGFSIDEMNFESEPIPKEHEEILLKIKETAKIIIGYAGGHAPSNALKSFISASKSFTDNKDISFVLVGNGSQKAELIQIVKDNSQENIYFLPTVKKTSIPNLLNYFDILYAGGIGSILHSYGTSYNKITDYMLAEKPILFAVDEPNSLVEKVGCGIQISAENTDELVKTINFFTLLTVAQREKMGKKGKEYAVKELNYTSLANKFIDAIEAS